MDTPTYQKAKDLHWRIDTLTHQITTIKALRSFSSSVPEHPDTTATLKALLLQDLEKQLDHFQDEFSKL